MSFCYSCDCYLLKDILQNWSDEDAALILDNLFKAMKPGSRLLLIEAVLHTGSHSEERVGCTLTFRSTILISLVPRLSVGGGKREPGIHCLCMLLISQKSWKVGNYCVISVKP